MSGSVTDKRVPAHRWLLTSLLWTLFCEIFAVGYEFFSHGVISGWMVFLFVFPLLGGVLPALLIGRIKQLRFPGPAAFCLFRCGIATLTAGSCVAGIFAIYGSSSDWQPLYWIFGSVLTGIGIALYLYSCPQSGSDREQNNRGLTQ